MVIDEDLLFANASSYAKSRRVQAWRKDRLGYGSDGTVWPTSRGTAIKACHDRDKFAREWECYRRLSAAKVRSIGGFSVPWLIDADRDLMVIEMGIVSPPYLLDFGKVKLDQPPTYFFDPLYQANRNAKGIEDFGDRWPDVSYVLYDIQKRFGIYYADPRPGNISLGYDPTGDDWEKEPAVDYNDYD